MHEIFPLFDTDIFSENKDSKGTKAKRCLLLHLYLQYLLAGTMDLMQPFGPFALLCPFAYIMSHRSGRQVLPRFVCQCVINMQYCVFFFKQF